VSYVLSNGVQICWEQHGTGDPVVLVHGFCETKESIWHAGGWLQDLIDSGRQVISMDLRGHGESDRPHEPEAYAEFVLADDLAEVLRAAGVDRAHFVGFSLGGAFLRPRKRSTAMSVDALRRDDLSDVHPMLQKFRRRIEERGGDRLALAALMEAERTPPEVEMLAKLDVPILFVSGETEAMVGDAEPIAEHVPGSRLLRIPDAGHDEAVMALQTREAALAFFDEIDAAG
jgi:pimeloyl-ACP methyl ester carboxylesterase